MRVATAIILSCLATLGSSAESVPEAPLSWTKPLKLPTYDAKVADDAYATWKKRDDPFLEAKADHGCLVVSTNKAAPVGAIGLNPGDILIACDEDPMVDPDVMSVRADQSRKLTWVTGRGATKTAEIPAGKIGANMRCLWLPTVAVRLGVKPATKGRDELTVAAKALYEAPLVAEAALARAIAAGYRPDPLTHLMGAFVKLGQGKVWEARDLAWYAYQGPNPHPQARKLLGMTAMATFQWQVALSVLDDPNEYLPTWKPDDVKAAIVRVKAAKVQPLPSAVIGDKPHIDTLRQAVCLHPGEEGVEFWTGIMRERGWGKLQSQSERTASIFVAGPPLADADLRAFFTVRPLGSNKIPVERRVSLGFVDGDSVNFKRFGRDVSVPGDYAMDLLEHTGLEIWPTLDQQWMRVALPIRMRFDGQAVHAVRIAVVGQRFEVFYGDQRIYLGWRPEGERRKLHPYARIFNTAEANLTHMEVCDPARPDPDRASHLPPRETKPAAGDTPAPAPSGAGGF